MRNNEKNHGENKDFLATWITRSSRVMTEKGLGGRMTERGNGAGMTKGGLGWRMGLLTMMTIFPALAQAQVCTITPDCVTLGYNKDSCASGGIKCPWGNKWFCPESINSCFDCEIGKILNDDLSCSTSKISGKTPIGVVFDKRIINDGTVAKRCRIKAIAMKNINGDRSNLYDPVNKCGDPYKDSITVANCKIKASEYGKTPGWYLPTKEDLLLLCDNTFTLVNNAIAVGGGEPLAGMYLSSSLTSGVSPHWVVTPGLNCSSNKASSGYGFVRPAIEF